MKPVIGITANISPPDDRNRGFSKGIALHYIQHSYIGFIESAGGSPVILPVVEDEETVSRIIDSLDGVLITGGVDIEPDLYGEPNTYSMDVDTWRDGSEIKLVNEARRRQVPIMGICRGIQLLCIAFGGSLYQDIYSSIEGVMLHTRSMSSLETHNQSGPETYHNTRLTGKSFLTEIFDGDVIRVNSSHHQSLRDPGDGLTVVSRADDSVVEAVQCFNDRCTIGVQWHPERMDDDEKQRELARWFVSQACK